MTLSHSKILIENFAQNCSKKDLKSEMNTKYDRSLEIYNVFLTQMSNVLQIRLVVLLDNAFKENRYMAYRILCSFGSRISIPLEILEVQASGWILSLKTCEDEGGANLQSIVSSILPRDQVASKMNDLLSFIKDTLRFALSSADSFMKVTLEKPLIGSIICIKSYIHAYPKDIEFCIKFLELLDPLSQLIYPILFHQSPEGCIPEEIGELTEDNSDDSSNTCQILSCFCWRSLKEYSEVVALVFSKLKTCLTLCFFFA
jgi:hypothetical protein